MGKCQLYRHYDARGRLLYIGISLSAAARLGQHRDSSPWFEKIKAIFVETYATRDEAIAAEKETIGREKPLFNKVFNGGGLIKSLNPDDQARLKHLNEKYEHLVTRQGSRGDPEYYIRIKGKYVAKVAGEFGSDEFFERYLELRKKHDRDYQKSIFDYWAAQGVEYMGEVNGLPRLIFRMSA